MRRYKTIQDNTLAPRAQVLMIHDIISRENGKRNCVKCDQTSVVSYIPLSVSLPVHSSSLSDTDITSADAFVGKDFLEDEAEDGPAAFDFLGEDAEDFLDDVGEDFLDVEGVVVFLGGDGVDGDFLDFEAGALDFEFGVVDFGTGLVGFTEFFLAGVWSEEVFLAGGSSVEFFFAELLIFFVF